MPSHYLSFLLRLWLEPNSPPAWRSMLENPVTGERHGFANLEALIDFIRQETERLEREERKKQNPSQQGDLP